MGKCIVLVQEVVVDGINYKSHLRSLMKAAGEAGYSKDQIIIIQNHGEATDDVESLGIKEMEKLILEDQDILQLFVWNIGRLGTSQTIILDTHLFLLQNGINGVFVQEGLSMFTDGHEDFNTSEAIRSYARQFQFSDVAKVDGRRRKRSVSHGDGEGKKTAGKAHSCIFGYKVDADGKVIVDPVEGAVVKEIFDRYTSGDRVLEIYRDLSSSGRIRTYANELSGQVTINRYLNDPTYKGSMGTLRYSRDKVYYPAIVTEEQFGKVRELRRHRGKKY